MYEITFLSEDGHQFKFTTREKNKDTAIEKGYDKLKELHYDIYGYSLKEVREVDSL